MNKLFPIVLALLFFGCDEGKNKTSYVYKKTDWTYLEQQQALEGCISTSDFSTKKEAGCLCMIDIIMQKYSFNEYIKEKAKMYRGNASEEFMNTMVKSAFECSQTINNE